MKKKTKNKQDATIVNVRAAKKRESKLEKRIALLEKKVVILWLSVAQMERTRNEKATTASL